MKTVTFKYEILFSFFFLTDFVKLMSLIVCSGLIKLSLFSTGGKLINNLSNNFYILSIYPQIKQAYCSFYFKSFLNLILLIGVLGLRKTMYSCSFPIFPQRCWKPDSLESLKQLWSLLGWMWRETPSPCYPQCTITWEVCRPTTKDK